MKIKTVLLSLLTVAMLAAGPAYAAPSVKVSDKDVTITESMTDEGFAQVKSAAQTAEKVVAKKIVDADLEKIAATFPNIKTLEVEGTKELSTLAPLAKLTNLKKLKLRAEGVSDFTPLAALTGLESIDVGSSNMAPDLKWMSNMTKLKNVYIMGGSSLTSFEGLPAIPSLKKINFVGAAPADLSPLLVLTGLTSVELTGCQIADLTPLTKLANLDDLSLYGSTVKDFSPLADCAKLKKLMYYAVKDADFSTLGKLTQLTELTGGLTQLADISWIENLPNLKMFKMFAEYITDYTPLTKTNLEMVQIWNMKEPVGDLAVVGQTKSLKELKLWSVDGATNSKALSGLANLEKFAIVTDYNKKSGEPFDFAAASGWAKVKDIDVTGAALVNTDGIASAAAVESLKFSKITGDQPVSMKFLAKMSKLGYISLNECKVADFDAIAGCQALKTVSLTKVDGITSLDALKKLPNLKNLTVSKGVFSDADLSGFDEKVKITQR